MSAVTPQVLKQCLLKLFLVFCILSVEFQKAVESKNGCRRDAESGAGRQSSKERRKGHCYGLSCAPPKKKDTLKS